MRRPLIEITRSGQKQIAWGYRNLHLAHENLLKLCLSGRLRTNTTEMKNVISPVTNRQGLHFNDEVAKLLSYPGLDVHKRASKLSGTTVLEHAGALDVL